MYGDYDDFLERELKRLLDDEGLKDCREVIQERLPNAANAPALPTASDDPAMPDAFGHADCAASDNSNDEAALHGAVVAACKRG